MGLQGFRVLGFRVLGSRGLNDLNSLSLRLVLGVYNCGLQRASSGLRVPRSLNDWKRVSGNIFWMLKV